MKWLERVPSWLSVAAGGYAVVGVFGLAFWTIRSAWPNLGPRPAIIIAAMVAAPLGLALVWQRLATLKFFGIEVSLSRVTVSIDEKISAVITQQQYFSGSKHIISQMRSAIMKREMKVIEVNLHSEPYWWSTRLFLLAALADDYSGAEKFVIVEGGAERIYVGMISPHTLRRSLATQFPELEVAYQVVHQRAEKKPELALSPGGQVDEIVEQWTATTFCGNAGASSEEQLKILVTSQLLSNWVAVGGGELETDFLKWDGGPESALLNYMLVCRSSKYVPLVRGRSLEKVVNRIDLAVRVAENALRRQLS